MVFSLWLARNLTDQRVWSGQLSRSISSCYPSCSGFPQLFTASQTLGKAGYGIRVGVVSFEGFRNFLRLVSCLFPVSPAPLFRRRYLSLQEIAIQHIGTDRVSWRSLGKDTCIVATWFWYLWQWSVKHKIPSENTWILKIASGISFLQ